MQGNTATRQDELPAGLLPRTRKPTGVCRLCGRRVDTLVSQRLGLGPKCLQRLVEAEASGRPTP